MRRALRLARDVLGRTSPNPAVGAVVLRAGVIVGEGATRPPAGDHAEVVALQAAGAAARGATLLVTLEPCNHHGRTPPCTAAILRAGISRVVIATRDPNPDVAGAGLEHLRAHGVEVDIGLSARAAGELNYGFFKLATTGRPFVTAKWAMTLDGKIARPRGGGAISGAAARRTAHRLRDAADAVLVGAGTARIDDPRLTVRPPPADQRQPLRVVLDSRAGLPPQARLLAQPGRKLICATEAAPASNRKRLEAAGAELLICEAGPTGRISLPALLDTLGRRGLASLLVEGGARVLGAFFAAEAVDRVVVFVAPRVMGDGLPALVGPDATSAPQGLTQVRDLELQRLDEDVMLAGYLRRYDPPGV